MSNFDITEGKATAGDIAYPSEFAKAMETIYRKQKGTRMNSQPTPDNSSPCKCTHSLSAFVASLIPQAWMQSASHCPAVRCVCGKQYYSFSERKAFESKYN